MPEGGVAEVVGGLGHVLAFATTRRLGELVPKVLDFGISTLDGERDLTRPGETVGTPAYMSPEQAKGSGALDGRTDQYAIGVVLYRAITGRMPFDGDTIYSVLHAVVSGRFTPPSAVADGVPPALEAVILQAMAKAPERRFASMKALGAALLPVAGEAARARWAPVFAPLDQPTAELSVSRPTPRRRRAAWAIALALAAAGLAFTVRGPSTYRVEVVVEPASAEIELDGEPAGIGALTRELPRDGRAHTLRVHHAEHEPAVIVFTDAPPPPQLALRPRPKPAPPAPAIVEPPARLARPRPAPPPVVPPPPAEPRRGPNDAPILR